MSVYILSVIGNATPLTGQEARIYIDKFSAEAGRVNKAYRHSAFNAHSTPCHAGIKNYE